MKKRIVFLLSFFLIFGMFFGFIGFNFSDVLGETSKQEAKKVKKKKNKKRSDGKKKEVQNEEEQKKEERRESEEQRQESNFIRIIRIGEGKEEKIEEKKEEKIVLKFKKTSVREVLNTLANAFEFYYVIYYPNFEYDNQDLTVKVVYKATTGSEQDISGPEPFPSIPPSTPSSGPGGGSPSPTSSSPSSILPSSSSSQSSSMGDSLNAGSDFENRLLTFYVSEDKRNVKNVIDLFCRVADVKCEYEEEKRLLKIIPYVVQTFDYGFFMDYSVSNSLGLGDAGGSSVGGSTTPTAGGGTGGTGGTGGSSGRGSGSTSFSVSETFKEFIEQVLSKLKSPEGRVFWSNRGYIIVVDRPSAVERIKEVWEKEIKKQEPVLLNVKVIRIDLKKSRESGIDWNAVVNKVLGSDFTHWKFEASFLGGITKGLSFTYESTKLNTLLKLLQEYGDVKIVYDWSVKARSGIPIVFADTQSIPYVTQTVIMNQQTTQTATTPAFVDVGLKINVVGSFGKKCKQGKKERDQQDCAKKYEGQVFVSISDLVKLENLGTSTNPYFVPNVKFSSAVIPFELQSNESIMITSFKTSKKEKINEGIPWLMDIPLFGNLFRYSKDYSGISEFLIVVTPTFEEDNNKPDVIYKKKTN